MNKASHEHLMKLADRFSKFNIGNMKVASFLRLEHDEVFGLTQTLMEIQDLLKFSFHYVQKLCLGYLSYNNDKRQFIQFGIGNGKTLLCFALGINFAKSTGASVFIIGKNEHLVLRDQKKYEGIIAKFGLLTNFNDYSERAGVYYLTLNKFETLMKD
jgi:hypothetical protein